MQGTGNHTQTRLKIGAVARLTGLSVHVLRKWEERHQAVVPVRTARGERLYERDDVRRLALMKQLTDAGLGLSEIAHMALPDLESVASDVLAPQPATPHTKPRAPVRVMVVGDALPALAGRTLGLSGNIEIVGSAPGVPAAGAVGDELGEPSGVDVLVLELPTLRLDTLAQVRNAAARCDAKNCVVVYGFASEAALAMLRKPEITLLRAPANADALERAIIALASDDGVEAETRHGAEPRTGDAIPPRRLSRETIARVVARAPSVKCECPHHIGEILLNLLAFEQYSAECESSNPEDAALHRYLAATAARSRAAFEDALIRVARAEGIAIDA